MYHVLKHRRYFRLKNTYTSLISTQWYTESAITGYWLGSVMNRNSERKIFVISADESIQENGKNPKFSNYYDKMNKTLHISETWVLFLFLFFVIYRRNFMPMQITAHAIGIAMRFALSGALREWWAELSLDRGALWLCQVSFDFEGLLNLITFRFLGVSPGAGADPNKSECNKKLLGLSWAVCKLFFLFFFFAFWGIFFLKSEKNVSEPPPPLWICCPFWGGLCAFFLMALVPFCLAKVGLRSLKCPFWRMALPFQILNSSPAIRTAINVNMFT